MYQGFNDMFDGGGAGASGKSFEGGGLLSMIANLIASPRGSQQGQPQKAMKPMGGLLSPQPRPAMPQQFPNTPPPGFQPPMQNLGRGDVGMPQPPMQNLGRGDYGMPQPPQPQYPNTAPPGFQPQNLGRGDYGMPRSTNPRLSFEDFVTMLGPSANTVPPEIVQEAYRLHMFGNGQ
jgi:hypothetical protein